MSKSVRPSPEQLAVLVDRAARRLEPEEGELLRAGFAGLQQARRSVGGLQAALQRALRERDAARAGSEIAAASAPSSVNTPPLTAPRAPSGPEDAPPRDRPADGH